MRRAFGLALTLATFAIISHADEPAPRFEQRWVYSMYNLAVPKNVDVVSALIERAAKAGYNGIVLADFKFNRLGQMGPDYFKNVARVKAVADKHGVEIIPTLFPVGYSDGLLIHDPNLAEGLPVKDAPFVVKGREAVLVPDPPVALVNGDLEKADGNRFAGFALQDDPGVVTFADAEVHHGGARSCRFQDFKSGKSGNARLVQNVRVRPHASYRLSAWVKTRDLSPARPHFLAMGKSGKGLTFHEPHLKPTADWSLMEVTFNSLEETQVAVYVGLWGGKSGAFWIDDLKIEELGLVNVLRRDGCPLTVTSADGKTTYEEGRDYLPVRDANLGKDSPGRKFGAGHSPAPLALTENSRIKDGDRLRVSWYHPVSIHDDQVMCCLTEPKLDELLRDQAKRVNDLLRPRTFFMGHDEIRVAGWCRACQSTGKTPGQLLADNVRRCISILRELRPDAKIVVWSDMFDPNHNALDRYYLVNGSLKGSWEGLPKDAIIANWNRGKAEKSLPWFAERGHPLMLAGYYDAAPETFSRWAEAARGVPNVRGFMYTTWRAKYDDLEAYSRAMLGVK
jgi:hypothetical protein